MDIRILVAHHKKYHLIADDVYLPIHVGKEHSQIELDIIGDNTGDNISIKNPIYCEMTAIYWGWKNLRTDYIGLCHYRRYFTFKEKTIHHKLKEIIRFYGIRCVGNILKPGSDCIMNKQLFVSDMSKYEEMALDFSTGIKKCIQKHDFDAIVPSPYHFACRNVKQFFEVLGRDHISLICDIVDDIAPELSPYFHATLSSNKLYAANMFIMKSEIYNDYCQIIFPILFEHEK